MSKLAEKIRRAGRVEAAPIGFGVATERRVTPALLCILRLDKDQLKKANGFDAADAVVVSGVDASRDAGALKKLGEVTLGLALPGADRAAVAAAREAGADFVALDVEAAAETLLEPSIGLVLRLGGEISDAHLRTLAGLPLDALEVAPPQDPFDLRRLMELRRLPLLSQTPLLVETAPGVEASRLEALREAGVAGVILDGRHADKLPALRQAVLAVPARGRRREEHAEALLPSLVGPYEAEDEEPDIE